MQHAWNVFLHYFLIVAPWLVVVGIPSLIVGLTPYPKAAGTIKVLSAIMNVLSALTHSDSPGTFKRPFTPSKPPGEDATGYIEPSRGRSAGFLRTELLFILAILGVLGMYAAGCAAGTDGLRQSCANADTALSGGYQTASAWYHGEQVSIRAQKIGDLAGADRRFTRDEAIMSKALDELDAASVTKTALCALADAIDAGLKRDIGVLLAQVVQVILDVKNAIKPILTAVG